MCFGISSPFVYNAKIRTFFDMAKFLTYFNILKIRDVSRETSVKQKRQKQPPEGAGAAPAAPKQHTQGAGRGTPTHTTTDGTAPLNAKRPKPHRRTQSHSPPLPPQGGKVADDQPKSRPPGTQSQKERQQGTPPSQKERQTAIATRPKAPKHGERRGTPHKTQQP